MWLLLLTLSLMPTSLLAYSFEEAYAPYENRPRCQQNCRFVPIGPPPTHQTPPQTAPPSSYDPILDPLIEPSRSWEMIRTPSGDLYYNYGNGMIQTPHGVDLYTIY